MEISILNKNIFDSMVELDKLQSEKISIGSKHRIQKILKILSEHYKPFNESHIEILKKYNAVEKDGRLEVENPSIAFVEEFRYLSDQENRILIDPIEYSKIEDIETSNIYNFDILDKFLF